MQNEWTSISVDTEFDGEYLGKLQRTEPCGTVRVIYRVVENRMNKWVLTPNETLLSWMPIPPDTYETHAPGGCPL